MLAETRSGELTYWFAYLERRDRHARVEMARAIGLALGGTDEETEQASPDDPNPLNLPPPPR